MVKSLADLVREYDRGDDVVELVRAAMLRAGITHCFAASYDRNDIVVLRLKHGDEAEDWSGGLGVPAEDYARDGTPLRGPINDFPG
jgi:hypothetical protein